MPSSDKKTLTQSFGLTILAPGTMHLVVVQIILFCFPNRALGIGLFILVLAILLAFGCWYNKRRSGYKSLRSKSSSVSTVWNVVGEGEILDCKMALQNYRDFNSVVPDAPPAYDKVAADQSPPPYSPQHDI
ncbi:melanoma antigen recognized by T-cells 1 [Anomalospiza imberbis]|uniref:melanoma antigen recognized by T-cells 1 n=1 Tax=Anomalospiza imberbis TaxID=187417 RepID=UPI00358F735A